MGVDFINLYRVSYTFVTQLCFVPNQWLLLLLLMVFSFNEFCGLFLEEGSYYEEFLVRKQKEEFHGSCGDRGIFFLSLVCWVFQPANK